MSPALTKDTPMAKPNYAFAKTPARPREKTEEGTEKQRKAAQQTEADGDSAPDDETRTDDTGSVDR